MPYNRAANSFHIKKLFADFLQGYNISNNCIYVNYFLTLEVI